MKYSAQVFFAAFMALLIGCSSASAQTWCKRNNLNDAEQAICDNSGLGALDAEMNAVYYSIIKSISRSAQRALGASQKYWLRNVRNDCGYSVRCLRRVYNRRINALNSY